MSRLIGTAVVVWVIAALAILSPPSIVKGQVPMTGAGLGAPSSGAPAYTGPADCTSCSTSVFVWHGLRAMSSADRGNPLINLCDNAGANCADASSDASTGKLTVTSRGSDSCATADDCVIKIFYDRSGNGVNVSQSTVANMATLIHNCINSTLFCARFSGSQGYTSTAGLTVTSQPLTGAVVGARTGIFTTFAGIIGAVTCIDVEYTNSANTAGVFPGNAHVTQTASDSNQHSLIGILNNTSSTMTVDNSTSATGNGGTSGLSAGSGNYFLGGTACTGTHMDFGEGGFWSVAFSAGQLTALYNNQHSYYSVF